VNSRLLHLWLNIGASDGDSIPPEVLKELPLVDQLIVFGVLELDFEKYKEIHHA
jgi:hypothetical protein